MRADRPDYRGRTAVCIASGPSLTAEDVEAVRDVGPTIVTNTTFRLAPWADVLFAMDDAWWRTHLAEVRSTFGGKLLTTSHLAGTRGVDVVYGVAWFQRAGNSGASALAWAIAGRPDRVLLLGYDCQPSEGRMHWHGDHPKGLSNCRSMAAWSAHFKALVGAASRAGVEVVNCSRQTALQCFQRETLERALLAVPA